MHVLLLVTQACHEIEIGTCLLKLNLPFDLQLRWFCARQTHGTEEVSLLLFGVSHKNSSSRGESDHFVHESKNDMNLHSAHALAPAYISADLCHSKIGSCPFDAHM